MMVQPLAVFLEGQFRALSTADRIARGRELRAVHMAKGRVATALRYDTWLRDYGAALIEQAHGTPRYAHGRPS